MSSLMAAITLTKTLWDDSLQDAVMLKTTEDRDLWKMRLAAIQQERGFFNLLLDLTNIPTEEEKKELSLSSCLFSSV